MSNFIKGDFVKDQKGNVGKVTEDTRIGTYVFVAHSGQNGFFMKAEPATKEEYDKQVEQRLHPQPKEQTAHVLHPQEKKLRSFRWYCLECGAKYNGRECPRCGGEDRIYNTDKDSDKSLFAETGPNEPYTPGE